MAITDLSLTELAAAVRRGELSAVSLAEHYLEQARRLSDLNIFIGLDEGAVLAKARAADWCKNKGPLCGIPFGVKDNIDVAGMPTTGGTPALRNNVPERSSPVVARLEAAGAYVIGKTNMHEMAFGTTNANPVYGMVPNPHNKAHISGGSSAGSAAGVAAGIFPFALGTDTGGSVRIPAALCGAAGLRPTTGRYPAEGIIPATPSRDTIGPIAQYADDLAVLDRVIASGPDAAPAGDIVLASVEEPMGEALDQATAQAFDDAKQRLSAAGVTLRAVDLSGVTDLVNQIREPMLFYEAKRSIAAYLATTQTGIGFAQLAEEAASPDVRAMLLKIAGRQTPEEEYRAAMEQTRPRLIATLRAAIDGAGADALFFPTVAVTAPPIDGHESIRLGGRDVPVFEALVRNTNPGSMAGLPGTTIAAPVGGDSLPVGLALDAKPGSDRALLGVTAAVERILRPGTAKQGG